MWLEHDHGGFGWPQRGVGVEILVDLGPAGPQPRALVSLRRGREEIASWVAEGAGFSSDLRFDEVSFFYLGTAYAVEWVMSGTNDGPAGGQPATGRPYRVRGASVGTLNGEGLIAENRGYWNMAEVLAQIGLTPA